MIERARSKIAWGNENTFAFSFFLNTNFDLLEPVELNAPWTRFEDFLSGNVTPFMSYVYRKIILTHFPLLKQKLVLQNKATFNYKPSLQFYEDLENIFFYKSSITCTELTLKLMEFRAFVIWNCPDDSNDVFHTVFWMSARAYPLSAERRCMFLCCKCGQTLEQSSWRCPMPVCFQETFGKCPH